MKSPLVRRKTHEAEMAKANTVINEIGEALAKTRNESAEWQVQYRMIRSRIVDLATDPRATPQIKATLAEFTSFRP